MKRVVLSTALTIASITSQASDFNWETFHQNPKSAMQSIPSKYDEQGKELEPRIDSLFTEKQIRSRRYLTAKMKSRPQLAQSPQPATHYEAVTQLRQRVASFLDPREFKEKNIIPVYSLQEIEDEGLLAASLEQMPWSDTYWPIYKGILGQRYTSDSFNAVGINFNTYRSAVIGENSLTQVLARKDPFEIENLSPAEKYDLLIGIPEAHAENVEGFLAPKMWEEGQYYADENGDVETWMGICHGWAAASFMAPAPLTSVEVPSSIPDLKVSFFPSDLKGLTSYIWAKGDYDSSFIGGRCNHKDAKVDEETGRLLDPECFDVSPAVWHLAVINQIGKAQRSFVMDASYDYEVWNQPVYSYSIQYVNPQTAKKYSNYKDAKINLSSYTKDKFKKWRSPKTKEIVGVRMEVKYVVENSPSHDLTEDDTQPRSVSYAYDLELNAQGEIVGGEWYLQAHPDFLWLPRIDAKPESVGDQYLKGMPWDVHQALPQFWKDIAITTAVRYGQPLSKITDLLIETSNQNQ